MSNKHWLNSSFIRCVISGHFAILTIYALFLLKKLPMAICISYRWFPWLRNELTTTRRCVCNFESVFFELKSRVKIFCFSCEITLILLHYGDVIMVAIASQITSLTSVYSTVYSDADQRKHQSSASLAFVRGIHRRPVNSPHKWPVTRKMFPFDDVIMRWISEDDIGPGDRLLLSGSKSLPEPTLTKLYDAIWRHEVTNLPLPFERGEFHTRKIQT